MLYSFRIQKILGWILVRTRALLALLLIFLCLLTQIMGQYLKICHDRFLPRPLRFITQNHTAIRRCETNTFERLSLNKPRFHLQRHRRQEKLWETWVLGRLNGYVTRIYICHWWCKVVTKRVHSSLEPLWEQLHIAIKVRYHHLHPRVITGVLGLRAGRSGRWQKMTKPAYNNAYRRYSRHSEYTYYGRKNRELLVYVCVNNLHFYNCSMLFENAVVPWKLQPKNSDGAIK